MDPFRFRPLVVGLEDRLTPAVSQADLNNATATIAAMEPALQWLAMHQNTLTVLNAKSALQTALPAAYQSLMSATSTMAEFRAEALDIMATDPALMQQFGPYIGQITAAAFHGLTVAGAAHTLGVAMGAQESAFSPPSPPPPPPPPSVTSTSDTSDSGMSDTLPDVTAAWTTTQSDGLKIRDVVEGTGDAVPAGASITIQYTGWLLNGTVFDSTRANLKTGATGTPTTFGLDSLIKGWQEGIPGMKPGGIRQLYVPSALGYGTAGSGSSIPPNSDLVFEIKMVSFTPAAATTTGSTTTSGTTIDTTS